MPVRFVTFEISESSFEDLDRFARSNGQSRSAAIRQRLGLGNDGFRPKVPDGEGPAYEWHQRRKAARANGEAA
jgi:Ribbon-helix-helix protein, copG family